LAKFVDWSALQAAYAIGLRSVAKSKWKLVEALPPPGSDLTTKIAADGGAELLSPVWAFAAHK
jgi:hypothetical protein